MADLWEVVVRWATTERVSAFVAVAALAGSVVSWARSVWSGRQTRESAARAERRAESAVRSAKRANKLARGANQLSERKAVAQEEMAKAMAAVLEAQDRQQAATPDLVHVIDRLVTASASSGGAHTPSVSVGVRWTVHRADKHKFQLLNIGDAIAHNVSLTSSNAVRLDVPGNPILDEVAPGQDVSFMAIGSWQSGPPEIDVEWFDEPGGEPKTWRRIVP